MMKWREHLLNRKSSALYFILFTGYYMYTEANRRGLTHYAMLESPEFDPSPLHPFEKCQVPVFLFISNYGYESSISSTLYVY